MKALITIVFLLLALCRVSVGQQKLQFYWSTDNSIKISTAIPVRAESRETPIMLPKEPFSIPSWIGSRIEIDLKFSYKIIELSNGKKYGFLFDSTNNKWVLFFAYRDGMYYYDPNFVNSNTRK